MLPLILLTLLTTCLSQAVFNGLNVPWNKFGYDIGAGSFDSAWFDTFFAACSQNHINSVRFWLHCDGRASPSFYPDGTVSGLSSTFLSELKQLLDKAASHKVVVMLTLWSFDMCKKETPTSFHYQLLSNSTATQTYVNKALIPMLSALQGYQNVVWEVINEPEWCIKETPGNTDFQASLSEMQAFVGAIAEAIHSHSSHKVTVGSASLKWNSDANPPALANWWSDRAIYAAYPHTGAKLDFYQVHYYDWMHNDQWGYDPVRGNTTYWKLDKPTVVGELPSTGGQFYTALDFMERSYANGFVGCMFWSYNADFDWHSAIPAWNGFFNGHSDIASYDSLVAWLKTL